MTTPPPLPSPGPSWPVVLFWCLIAALAGLACVALPALLFAETSTKPLYGDPLIPWFARVFSHIQYQPTMISFFVLATFLGFVVPQRWLMLGSFSVTLMLLLHIINVIHDIGVDPTSHNLFPFEFAILVFLSLPVLPGAFLGSRIRRRIRTKSMASPQAIQ